GHIYVADKDAVSSHDNIGFAAIGGGSWHAESQFMFARYAKWASMARCMLVSYIAKKRAEVAPGVGSETDMWAVVGLRNLTLNPVQATPYVHVSPSHLERLDTIYQRLMKREMEATSEANEAMETYAEEIEAEAEREDRAANEGKLRDGPQEGESKDFLT